MAVMEIRFPEMAGDFLYFLFFAWSPTPCVFYEMQLQSFTFCTPRFDAIPHADQTVAVSPKLLEQLFHAFDTDANGYRRLATFLPRLLATLC